MNANASLRNRISLLVASVVLGLCQGIAVACPTCKDALAGDANAANLVNGFGWSILFMMAMPFLILSGIGAYFYYEIRKARHAQPAPQSPAVTPAGFASLPDPAHGVRV